jgi:predicted membrane GTPase involved in stress response
MCEEEFEIMDKLKAKEAELDLKLTEASSQTGMTSSKESKQKR